MSGIKSKVILKEGSAPGKTVAIFCGVHGNERVGIDVLKKIEKELVVHAGKVYLVYANLKAIKNNVRFVESNLNRAFIRRNKSVTYEEKLADILMDVLDECDALLDLHAYRKANSEGTPFVICEADAYNFVSKTDFPIILSGIDSLQKGGSDGYMFNQGKIGVCAELGAISEPEKYIDLGIKTVYQFLAYFGNITWNIETTINSNQKYAELILMYKKQTENFSFVTNFNTFDFLTKDQVIAIDGSKKIYAPDDGYIIFPNSNDPVGTEAFLFARLIK